MNKSLKWFLIQRFIIALVFIAVAENLLNTVYRMALPGLLQMLQLEGVTIDSEGSLLMLMLQMVLYFAVQLLPKGIATLLEYQLQKIMAGSWQLKISAPELQYMGNSLWGSIYQFGILLVFILLFAVTLVPYVVAILWYYFEISRKVKELLEQEEEQKRAYDKARNLMLSDIAHDIKTPITTICGYARTLTDGVVEVSQEQQRKYLQAIYTKSMRMSELITMLFEYVKMDSEGFSLHTEQGDLGELLRESVVSLYTDFEEKKIELEIEIPERDFPLEMDQTQMSRVIINILTNALKYNDAGTKVQVRLDEDYHIRIADTGAPIEEELAEHIFEPFSRGDRARSTKGGSGLGLSIAHKIVEMHGGSLRLNTHCEDEYTKAFEIIMPHPALRLSST